MRLNKIIAGLLIAGAVVSAVAHADGGAGDAAVGRVDKVYVREARGLFIEQKLLQSSAGKEVWVEVRGPDTVADKTTGEMFKVPVNLAIERGDLVATRIGDDSVHEMNLNLIPIPNKVTQLIARHDSLMAMTFGLPKAPGMVELFMSAKAH